MAMILGKRTAIVMLLLFVAAQGADDAAKGGAKAAKKAATMQATKDKESEPENKRVLSLSIENRLAFMCLFVSMVALFFAINRVTEAFPTARRVWNVLPSLAIFGSFLASALAMKIAPLFGLLPGDANAEILKSWTKFAKVPEIQMVLAPLGFDHQKFMITVAALHSLVAVFLLAGGKFGYKLAGTWAMISMAGAEFCTRKTSHVPAGFTEEYKHLGMLITTGTHLMLFLFGAVMTFSEFRGGLIKMLNQLLAGESASEKTPSSPVKKEGSPPSSPEQRGRTDSKKASGKRDSTPNPTSSAMKKQEKSPSPMKSSRGR